MAKQLNFLQATQLARAPVAQGVGLCVPMNYRPAAANIQVIWTDYIDVATKTALVGGNLLGQGSVTSNLDYIRSVYIDNTFCSVPVYIQFPDTQQTIVCPANSVCCAPAFTLVQEFYCYAEDFPTGGNYQTNFFLSNVDRQGFVISPSIAITLPTSSLAVSYVSTRVIDNSTGWTWTGVEFGSADATRMIIMPIAFTTEWNNTGTVNDIATVTIGGVAATLDASASVTMQNLPGANASVFHTQIWRALVPAGTTGSVDVTTSTALPIWANAGFYRIVNAFDTSAPFSTTSQATASPLDINTQGNTPQTSQIDMGDNSCVIDCAAAFWRTVGTPSPTTYNFAPINLTTDESRPVRTNTNVGSNTVAVYNNFASNFRTNAGQLPISINGIAHCAASYL